MLISIIAAVLAIAVAALSAVLVLGTLPARNEVKGNEIITHYVLGNKTAIDISNAVFGEIPEEAKSHLIRVGGTSLGRFHSGNFKNTQTGDKFKFYLNGKGTRVYFEADGIKYLVDLPEEDASALMEKSRKPLCGGYTEQREPTEEEMALFAAATGNSPEYTPLSVSTQVVAGINYRFWCRYEAGDDCGHCWITIFKPLPGRGEPSVTSIEKE